MLLAIWGPHAIGKTTFVNHLAGQFQNNSNLLWMQNIRRITIVQADLDNEWTAKKGWQKSATNWKPKQINKRRQIDNLVANDRRLYIVESARYFSGMYAALVSVYKQVHGGMYFIIPTASPDDLQWFIRQRCIMKNKVYREDVWGARAKYESELRYTNPTRKWFEPAGIPFSKFTIERDRSAWSTIEELVWQLIIMPVEGWYD